MRNWVVPIITLYNHMLHHVSNVRMNGDMALNFAVRETELSMKLRDALEGQYPNQEVAVCIMLLVTVYNCIVFFVQKSLVLVNDMPAREEELV